MGEEYEENPDKIEDEDNRRLIEDDEENLETTTVGPIDTSERALFLRSHSISSKHSSYFKVEKSELITSRERGSGIPDFVSKSVLKYTSLHFLKYYR